VRGDLGGQALGDVGTATLPVERVAGRISQPAGGGHPWLGCRRLKVVLEDVLVVGESGAGALPELGGRLAGGKDLPANGGGGGVLTRTGTVFLDHVHVARIAEAEAVRWETLVVRAVLSAKARLRIRSEAGASRSQALKLKGLVRCFFSAS